MPQNNPWGPAGVTSPPYPFTQQGQQNQMGVGHGRMAGFNGPGAPEPPLFSRPPYPPRQKPKNSRNLFMAAGLCVIVGALLLVLIFVLGTGGSGNASPSTTNTSTTGPTSANSASTPQATNTPATSSNGSTPTVSGSPTATGTAYPGQQYIDGAQMATGVDKTTMQPQQVTTTFTVGSDMYVVFQLHPPSTGGEVCALWYLNGNPTPITSYNFDVKSTSHASYTYAEYGSPGQAYVELYWASNNTCSDKVLAQHVDFTVTAS